MPLILPTTSALQRTRLVQLPVLTLKSQCLVCNTINLTFLGHFSIASLFFPLNYYAVAPVIVVPVDGELFRVNRTDDISIACSARGIPPPSIRFLRGGVELNRTGGESGAGMDLVSRVQLAEETSSVYMDDGTFNVFRMLTIFNVAEEDVGMFTCEASSTIPELSLSLTNRSVFELAVQCKH